MKKLIVTADDFGFNSKINRGIIDAHKNGVVTSTSLFVTREGFKEAIYLAKENPRLEIGLHLDLDTFFNIDHSVGKIIGWSMTPPPLDEVEKEIKRQIEIFKSTGLILDHITSHHQTHLIKDVFLILCRIAKEYNIRAIRLFKKFYNSIEEYNYLYNILKQNDIVSTEHFIEGWYWGNIDEEFNNAELMTHPGYGELWREYELLSCCSSELKNYLREKNIQLITFRDLR
jgi:predicted glycoside hydrolase/deacetylase ChbG (UPF0249 family)